jgi:uncharacterized protein DUF5818
MSSCDAQRTTGRINHQANFALSSLQRYGEKYLPKQIGSYPSELTACKRKHSYRALKNTRQSVIFGKVFAPEQIRGGVMKGQNYSLHFLGTLVLAFGILSLQLYAQPPAALSSQYPQQAGQDQQPKQPGATPDQSGQQTADSHAQPAVQVFTGTIMKSGDKYVLQESASGTAYDIDRQDTVRELEGKKVRVHGTLDPDGKTIHVQ